MKYDRNVGGGGEIFQNSPLSEPKIKDDSHDSENFIKRGRRRRRRDDVIVERKWCSGAATFSTYGTLLSGQNQGLSLTS